MTGLPSTTPSTSSGQAKISRFRLFPEGDETPLEMTGDLSGLSAVAFLSDVALAELEAEAEEISPIKVTPVQWTLLWPKASGRFAKYTH